MLRDVHGTGTLVAEDIRVIAASTAGRMERVLVHPGTPVNPRTILVELSNPELQQSAVDTEYQLRAAEAEQKNLKVRLESDRMTQEAATATVRAEYQQAKLQLDADEDLAKQGVLPALSLKLSRVRTEDLANRYQIEQKRLEVKKRSDEAQLGTLTVDVALEGRLPAGAVPDLTVDGTVELERLDDVIYISRPAFGQAQSTIKMFKLDEEGKTATRVQVKLGRSSVNAVEILEGLQPGDRVIISDTSSMDAFDHIRLN